MLNGGSPQPYIQLLVERGRLVEAAAIAGSF